MNQNERLAYAIGDAAFQLGALRKMADSMIEQQDGFLPWDAFANLVVATTVSATLRLDACLRVLNENGEDSNELASIMDYCMPEGSPLLQQEGGAA